MGFTFCHVVQMLCLRNTGRLPRQRPRETGHTVVFFSPSAQPSVSFLSFWPVRGQRRKEEKCPNRGAQIPRRDARHIGRLIEMCMSVTSASRPPPAACVSFLSRFLGDSSKDVPFFDLFSCPLFGPCVAHASRRRV